jgi:predicted amidohydrolase
MANKLRVALVSLKNTAGDVAANLTRHQMWLHRAIESRAKFIGFPEFALTGWVNDREQTLRLNSSPVRLVEAWARKHRVWIATCLVEQRGKNLHNACVIAGPNGRIGVMRKVNLVGAESPHYTSGREFPVLSVAGVSMGVTTCADASYFEMMRILSYRGAEVIFAPHANTLGKYGNNASGWLKWRSENWPTYTRDCAITILGINNAGLTDDPPPDEQPTKFCGGGAIFDYTGHVAAVATVGDTKKECMIVADIDLAGLREARKRRLEHSEFRAAIVYNRKRGWKYGRV